MQIVNKGKTGRNTNKVSALGSEAIRGCHEESRHDGGEEIIEMSDSVTCQLIHEVNYNS